MRAADRGTTARTVLSLSPMSLGEQMKESLDEVEKFAVDVVYDRRKDRTARIVGGLLRGLSLLFASIVRARLFLYDRRILRSHHLGCLVVVVGNLTVGGTGKTPVVEKFARYLADRGRTVAILSRGYKSRKEPVWKVWWRNLTHAEPPPPKVVSDGKNVLLDSAEAGDEPYMLARNLPGVVVLVDKNRVKAGAYAIRRFGADTLILDDGFQYLALRGRLNLLLIDKSNPFGNARLLPRGILREPIAHLKRASYVFLTKSDGAPDGELEATIRRHHPEVEIIECKHQPQYLQHFSTGERLGLDWLRGRRLGVFSGIAMPESFEAYLAQAGADLGLVRRFLDHHRFTRREIEALFETAREAGLEAVITTEKDAVRLPDDLAPPLPLYYLRMEIEILRGVNDFEEAVARVCFPKNRIPATRPPFPDAESLSSASS